MDNKLHNRQKPILFWHPFNHQADVLYKIPEPSIIFQIENKPADVIANHKIS